MPSIGIYPGSFDPFHDGHLAFARAAQQACELDKVIILPELLPRDKPTVSPINLRLEQIRLRLNDDVDIRVVTLTSPRFSVSESLSEINKLAEGGEITLLIGSDIAASLYQWEDLNILFPAWKLAIGVRGPVSDSSIEEAVAKAGMVAKSAIDYTFIRTVFSTMSSSQYRGSSQNKQK